MLSYDPKFFPYPKPKHQSAIKGAYTATEAKRLSQEGKTVNEAADELGMTLGSLRNLAVKHGIKFKRKPRED